MAAPQVLQILPPQELILRETNYVIIFQALMEYGATLMLLHFDLYI